MSNQGRRCIEPASKLLCGNLLSRLQRRLSSLSRWSELIAVTRFPDPGLRHWLASSMLLVATDRMGMTSRQLNIRLGEADRDRLEALAFVRRRHASVLAREIVLEYLQLHARESGMEKALRALLERDAAEKRPGDVRPIRRSRK